MSYWQGVGYLLWNDIRNARWKNLLLVVFVAYMVLFTISEMESIVTGEIDGAVNKFMVDYLYFMLFSVAGLITTHVYGMGIKKDLITERLAYWRSLPIKIDQIVYSRVTGVTIFTFLAILIYTIITGFVLSIRGVQINPLLLALHALTAFSIVYILNLFYLFIEMNNTLKVYMIFCWITPFVFLAIILTYTLAGDFSLLFALYTAVEDAPILMSCASIILSIASYLLAVRIIDKKLRARSIQ